MRTLYAARDLVRGTNVALIDARHRRFIPAMLAACVLCAAAPRMASAQVVGNALSTGLSTTVQLSPDQKTELTNFVNANTEALMGSNAAMVRAAMDNLRSPFTTTDIPNISFSFRHDYSEALLPTLKSMLDAKNLADANNDLPIRALSLAGELGNEDAATLLTKALGAARADVRYQAAYGLRRTFLMISQSRTPLMLDSAISTLIKATSDRAADEHDPLVLDALIRALQAAGEPNAQHSEAIRALGVAISTNAKNAVPSKEPAQAIAMLRAAKAMLDMLSVQVPLSAETARAGAEMAGQLVAYASRAVSQKAITAGTTNEYRQAIADLATASRNSVSVAYEKIKLGEKAPIITPLGDPLRAGTVQGDAQFLIDVSTFISEVLSRPPFGFAPGSFKL
ncbi:MAG: hypothetical protein WC718_00740 [Phycisphaerales bacterium]|jgi:hypothetical protein